MKGNISLQYAMSPTAERFHNDPADFRCLIGPVGGGKTVALCMEVLRLAMEQEPDYDEYFYPRRDGRAVRPTRWLMVRATYPQLKATLIKTWNEWTGKLGRMVYDSPIRFHAEFPMPDGTLVDLEVQFMALDGPRAAENLRSLEVTGIGFSEFAEIGQDIVEMASTRVGRFPKTKKDKATKKKLFGPTRPCMVAESNPPSTRSHWYKMLEVKRPDGVRCYKQPPAMLYDYASESYLPNPEAENIDNLPGGYDYYQRIIDSASSSEFINVYVMNNYGSTFAGKAVYPAFDVREHVLGDPALAGGDGEFFQPDRRRVVVGMDLGLNPSAAFIQENALGGLTVFDELAPEDMRFEDFLNDMFIPLVNQRFRGLPLTVIYDPSNPRSALSHHTAAQMMKDRGIHAVPAPSNDIPFRIEAVNYFLQRREGFFLHPRCVSIREGMAGGYHFEEVKGKNDVFRDVPTKNQYSHIMNGLEYGCSYFFYQVRRHSTMMRQKAAYAGQDKRKKFSYV